MSETFQRQAVLPGPVLAGAGTSAAPAVETATLSSAAELDAIADDWRSLEARSGGATTAFQSFDFLAVWRRHFLGEDRSARVVTVTENGRIVLIFPLVVCRSAFGMNANWLGTPVIQYGDVIAEANERLPQRLEYALEEIRQWGDIGMISLRNVRADALIYPWLIARARPLGEQKLAPSIDLTRYMHPAEFDEERSAKAKRNRRRRRQLEKLGRVRFNLFEGGEIARDHAAHAIADKLAWLDDRSLYSLALADGATRACLQELATLESPSISAAVSALSVDDEAAAMEIGFRYGGNYYSYLGSYSPGYAKLGPGNLQLRETIGWCIENDLNRFDMLAPADEYKLNWADHTVAVADFALIAGWRALLPYLVQRMPREHLKQVYKILPERFRNRLARQVSC